MLYALLICQELWTAEVGETARVERERERERASRGDPEAHAPTPAYLQRLGMRLCADVRHA